MTRFLLLLLLTSWTHLGSEARHCSTGIAITGHLVNIEGSRIAKADVAFIKAYNSSRLQNCLEDCCSAKYGLCSVAAFRNRTNDLNCLHYLCQPLVKCKFYPTDVADSYGFPSAADVSPQETSSSSTEAEARDRPRSVTARKGAENVALSRKGVSGVHLELENALKNDNTTIKPRKGVDFFLDALTTIFPESVVIEPVKDGANEQSRMTLKPKIKARKGVEPYLPRVVPTSTTVVPLNEITSASENSSAFENSTAFENSSNWKDNDLILMLKNVFRDELELAEHVSKIPELSLASSISYTSVANEVKPTRAYQVHLVTQGTKEPSSPSRASSAFATNLMPSSTAAVETSVLESRTSDYIESSFRSSSLRDQSRVSPSSIPRTSLIPIVSSTRLWTAPSAVVVTQSLSSSSTPVTATVQTKANSTYSPEEVWNSFSEPDQAVVSEKELSERERRYRSSMHLVLSLVFGLLVLFSVIGAVAKRIYDVWIRRHYSRMDFLIDGMYDGYS